MTVDRQRARARAVFVAACACAILLPPAPMASARTREFWVTAERRPWVILPNGRDAIENRTFTTESTRTEAIVYRRYTRNWRRGIPNRSGGLVGPLLRARVGDRVLVHFRNVDLDEPHSMHFHGVHYRPPSDGAFIPGFSGKGARVQPGHEFTYRLRAGADSAGAWPYHDHSPSMEESIDRGLWGMLSIFGRHERIPDRENVVVFSPMSQFMAIDGRAFVGNTPVFHSRVGDVVQWDVMAMGSDHHTFHVHGHRWRGPGGDSKDTQELGPADSFRVRWREDAPGTWLYHCHVEDHMMNGMIGIYRVARRR